MASKTTKSSNGLWASAVLMLLALLWLTVSLPFVYAHQQAMAATMEQTVAGKVDKQANPLAGTNEEKTETGVNTISEYLHETELPVVPIEALVSYDKCHPAHLYFAYHPELLCPPPNGVS